MPACIQPICRFLREEDAPTMLEYGLLLGAIAIVVATTFHQLSDFCVDIFGQTAEIAKNER